MNKMETQNSTNEDLFPCPGNCLLCNHATWLFDTSYDQWIVQCDRPMLVGPNEWSFSYNYLDDNYMIDEIERLLEDKDLSRRELAEKIYYKVKERCQTQVTL